MDGHDRVGITGHGESPLHPIEHESLQRIDVDGRAITVFNCHLKSKLGEFEGSYEGAPEKNLLNYDPVGRAIGEARSLMRRAAEAAALRRL